MERQNIRTANNKYLRKNVPQKMNRRRFVSPLPILLVVFSLSVFSPILRAQNGEVHNLVTQGVTLFDSGKYEEAVEKFEAALKIDPRSDVANYEMAAAYFALGKYDKCITHCDKALGPNSMFMDAAYMLKGNALDMAGKPQDAIKVYLKSLKNNPDNNLTHYNLGLTYYKLKEFDDSEKSLQNALQIKSTHAASHLLLGYLMEEKGERLKSILALFNFLLLEPKGQRAETAYTVLQEQLSKGVKKTGDNTITISLAPPDGKADDFRTAEMMISLLEASKGTEKNADKTEEQVFVQNTESLFGMLGGLQKDKKGFWWDFYVRFYNDMNEEKHVEALCYFISQTKEKNAPVQAWLQANQSKVERLMYWVNGYSRKF